MLWVCQVSYNCVIIDQYHRWNAKIFIKHKLEPSYDFKKFAVLSNHFVFFLQKGQISFDPFVKSQFFCTENDE